jgi:hypothetical protein
MEKHRLNNERVTQYIKYLKKMAIFLKIENINYGGERHSNLLVHQPDKHVFQ